ncbi:MAG: hypothetical protein BEN18_05830 [Epulopiscium sp. Nuni2H_MBin001]|nr:MAG: hypothetical protein BEN18_05830 [Epulopiscium sp. Nuni2H_MBin001]
MHRIQEILRADDVAWMIFMKVYADWEMEKEDYISIIPDECKWEFWAAQTTLTGEALVQYVNNVVFPTLKALPIDETTPPNQLIVKLVFEGINSYQTDGTWLRQVLNIINEVNFNYTDFEALLSDLTQTPRVITDFVVDVIKPNLGERVADFACGTGGFLAATLKYLKPQANLIGDFDLYHKAIYGMENKPLPYMLCIINMLLHKVENINIFHEDTLEINYTEYNEAEKFDVILINPSSYNCNEIATVQANFPQELRSEDVLDLFCNVIMFRLKENGRCAILLPDSFLCGTDSAKVNIKKKLVKEFNLHTIVRLSGMATNILFFDNTAATKHIWFYRADTQNMNPVLDWINNKEEIIIEDIPKAKCYTIEYIEMLNYNLNLCSFNEIHKSITHCKPNKSELDMLIDNLYKEIVIIFERTNILSN